MKTGMGIVVWGVGSCLALAGTAAAQTPPVSVSAQSASCFNQTGTIPLTCDIGCVSSQPCEDTQIHVCSNAHIDGATPGSANQPSGGTFEQGTCSQPTEPFGATFTMTGSTPPSTHNTVFFACVPSSLTGSTASFQISATDKTGPAASTTVTVPVCSASGPQFTVQKSLGSKGIVNGHTRVGDVIEFDVTVTNTGTAAGSFALTDNASDGLRPSSVESGGPPCDVTPSYIDCHFLSPGLPAGSTYTARMFFKVTKAGDLTNTAYVPGNPKNFTSNPVVIDARPPRPNPVREGLPPLRPLPGR